MNRLHVVPPCNITQSDAQIGLDILDQAFAVTDKYANA
jgi:4-aminobutyrate aminotransferase-like enzyme